MSHARAICTYGFMRPTPTEGTFNLEVFVRLSDANNAAEYTVEVAVAASDGAPAIRSKVSQTVQTFVRGLEGYSDFAASDLLLPDLVKG